MLLRLRYLQCRRRRHSPQDNLNLRHYCVKASLSSCDTLMAKEYLLFSGSGLKERDEAIKLVK